MQDNSKFELVDLLINDLNPSKIITCHHSDQQFIRYLKLKCVYKMKSREKEQIENQIENLGSLLFILLENAVFSKFKKNKDFKRTPTLICNSRK